MRLNPVRILAVYPAAGAWTIQGTNCIRGALLGAEDINADSGVLDRDLNVEVVAVGEEAKSAREAVARSLEAGGFSAIVGAYLSSHTLAYSSLAEEKRVPAITESFVSEVIGHGFRFMFKTTPPAADFSRAAFRYLADMHSDAGRPLPTIALAAADDASATQQYSSALASASAMGFEVLFHTQFPTDLPDPESLMRTLEASEAQAILLNGPVAALVQVAGRLRQSGFAGVMVGLGGAGVLSQSFAERLGSAVDGIFSTVAWNADISVAAARASERFQHRFGSPFMPVEAGTAYAAVNLAAEAVRRARSAIPEEVAEALRAIHITGGVASLLPGGRIAFDERGLNRYSYPLLVQYQGGTPVTVHPPAAASARAVL